MHNELPITGYLSRLSARPTETLDAKVSVRDGGGYRVRLVRVLSADPNPQGPGVRFEDLSAHHDATHAGRRQPILPGSWGEAPGPALDGEAACWTALILPGMAQAEQRVVLHHESPAGTLTLTAGPHGVEATLAWAGGSATARADGQLATQRWHRVWASLDTASGRLVAGFHSLPHLYEPAAQGTGEAAVSAAMPSGGSIRLAVATAGQPRTGFTGKIEDPAVLNGFREKWPAPLERLDDLGSSLESGWDLSVGIDSQVMKGTGRQARDGVLHNLPMRGVTGARWTGGEYCWRHAPSDYAAVKFHDDDLGDCGWETDFAFTVPDGLKSGSYALHLSCDGGEDWLPFFILPPRGGPHARVAFLASTFTYQAYGNHARGNVDAAFRERVAAWGAYPHNPDDYPIYGRSTYNHHADGTGVAFVSRRRPLLTMRPGFMTFVDANGSGLRHYPADHHLLAWMEARGIAYDVVTDEDLDIEGAGLLAPYKVVLTGSHPEYHTGATLDGLQAYVRDGGGLCYLGGNGFYWRIARGPDMPWTFELRRAEGGVRAWAPAPGEYYHSFDGQLGGLWRRIGRDPQQLAGVGFSAQGLYEAGWFRRTDESYDAAVSWIFDGVEGATFGDYGLSAGGAAGFELDRADVRLGTPANAVVVARSDGLPASFLPLLEDLRFPPTTLWGENAGTLVRGDMTWFDTAGGGAVFSASAITFCGSLWKDGAFGGPVSRLLENVVRRLADR